MFWKATTSGIIDINSNNNNTVFKSFPVNHQNFQNENNINTVFTINDD